MTAAFELGVVLPTRDFGGHERMLLTWLRRLQEIESTRIHLFSADVPALRNEAVAHGFDAPDLRFSRRGRRNPLALFADLQATWGIARSLRQGGVVLLAPGVVQTQWLHAVAAKAAGATVVCYVPMAFTSREMHFRWPTLRDYLVRIAISQVDLWVTISGKQRRLLVQNWSRHTPIAVVPNITAVPATRTIPRTDALAGPQPLKVAFIGRFDPNQKGLDWLVEVLRKHSGRWRGRMTFQFQGNGAFTADLLALASVEGIDHVKVLPWGDPTAVLSQADVLLLPSRFEGLPLIAMEAIEIGVPVVGTRQAGLEELVVPAHQFDFGDADGMFNVLNRLADPVERAQALTKSQSALRLLTSPAVFDDAVMSLQQSLEALVRRERPCT